MHSGTIRKKLKPYGSLKGYLCVFHFVAVEFSLFYAIKALVAVTRPQLEYSTKHFLAGPLKMSSPPRRQNTPRSYTPLRFGHNPPTFNVESRHR